jgi:negative regulator of flagellin synthesis FlgM
MTRIDGLGTLATSRTSRGAAATAPESDFASGSAGSSGASGLDKVNLSNRGRWVAEAARAVLDSPDVRADKVAQLKASIADGTYTSNARDIAARLMANGLGEQ